MHRRPYPRTVTQPPAGTTWATARALGKLDRALSVVLVEGISDRHEAEIFRRGLVAAEVATPRTRTEMENLGSHVCVDDLEDELIRAVGTARVEALFDAHGDLGSFRSLQSQPAWCGRDHGAQLRRFLGSGAGRKLRYARVLVAEAAWREVLPRPLDALLSAL